MNPAVCDVSGGSRKFLTGFVPTVNCPFLIVFNLEIQYLRICLFLKITLLIPEDCFLPDTTSWVIPS